MIANAGVAGADAAWREGVRVMAICNACRYCEGYCAVFPAMERRLDFTAADIGYLANLCHGCGECLDACQYAPPHEFGVDVPTALARARRATYRQCAWPSAFARLLDAGGVRAAWLLTAGISMLLFAAVLFTNADALFAASDGQFYSVITHRTMVTVFGAAALFVVLSFIAGTVRYWRAVGEDLHTLGDLRAWKQALSDVFTLRYLGSHATDCAGTDASFSARRRIGHHLTFYGFLLCFAATVAGTFYHYVLGMPAPYDYASLPVVLGTLGGIGLLVGPVMLYRARNATRASLEQTGENGPGDALITLLLLTSATGLLLLGLRETAAMGTLLVVHLAAVMALFITMPFGKFAHGIYRLLALLKYALEGRRPFTSVGGD